MAAVGKKFPIGIHVSASGTAVAGRQISAVSARIRRGLLLSLGAIGRVARRATERIGKLAVGFGAAATAGIAAFAAAGWKIASGHAQAIDALSESAAQAGLTAQAYAELRHGADLAGVSAEEFEGGVVKLTQSLGKLALGQGSLYSLLKKTNPAFLKQIRGATSTEAAIGILAEGMARLNDPVREMLLTQAAFGRGGTKMALFLRQGSDAIAQQRQEYARLAGTIDEEAVAQADAFANAQAEMKVAIGGLSMAIGRELLPVLTPLIVQATEWIVINRGRIADGIRRGIVAIVDVLKKINWDALIESAGRWFTSISRWLGSVDWAGILEGIGVVTSALSGLASAIKWIGEALGKTAAAVVLAFQRAGVAIASVWSGITAAVAAAWNYISGVVDKIGEALGKTAAAVVLAFQRAGVAIASVWSGITAAVAAAWNYISGVVDKIGVAIDKISAGALSITDALGITAAPSARMEAQRVSSPEESVPAHIRAAAAAGFPVPPTQLAGMPGALGGPGAGGKAEVVVRFEGAPAGTRVESAQSTGGGLEVSTKVGRRRLVEAY